MSISWIGCLRSVRESASPITYAPMIIARPMYSKNPASASARPKAIVAITTGLLNAFLRNFAIQGAARSPIAVAPSQTPNALSATRPIAPQSIAPAAVPAFATAWFATMMPLPIASTMRPRTSSITAPAMIVTPSSESICFFSERMRAVMPTEVAVAMMPM